MSKLKVALIQMSCSPLPAENVEKALIQIEKAAGLGAELICLPELFTSQYFCQAEDHQFFKLAEPIPGPTTEKLETICKKLKVTVVASLFEKRAQGLYHNTAVIIDGQGKMIGKYRKMHIPDDPAYYEKFYFTPGDLGFQAFQTAKAKVGVLVCWDQWYPEGARITALKGAEIIFFPTAIGWHPKEKGEYGERQHSSWETIQRSHAIANGVFVVVPNRVGHEAPSGGDGIEFWGQSFICDPSGQVVAKASSSNEEILLVELDLDRIDEQRTHWPFLRDRRVDAYHGIDQRYLD